MNLNDIASQKVAILGMGLEGLALADYLRGRCRSVTLLDQKNLADLLDSTPRLSKILKEPGYDSSFGDGYLDDLARFDVIFRSPGIRYLLPQLQEAKERGAEISSQIKFSFDLSPCKIIGVTGTKGKGTTSSLIFEILKKNVEIQMSPGSGVPSGKSEKAGNVYLAGNIGEPAVSLLPELKAEDIVILELSSFQLQDLEKSPQIAVVLNISSDHLDYHEDNDEYIEAKTSIVKFQTTEDFAIINMDYLTSFEFSAATDAKSYFFSGNKAIEDGAYVRAAGAEEQLLEVVLNIDGKEEIICNNSQIKLVGKHNLENIAAAALASYLAGADLSAIREASMSFVGLPHRLEPVGEINGVEIYNDSFSTNPEPTIAALRAFSQPKMLILGGSSKGADFAAMAKEIASSRMRAVALIGDEAENIKRALTVSNYDGELIEAGYDLNLAIRQLISRASSGDILIFSPACASFDMFKNYKDRGEVFKALVKALKND